MLYRINHSTIYHYSEPVTLCHNLLHLTPRPHERQVTLRSQILVTPEPGTMAGQLDYFGNPATFFSLQEPHQELAIAAQHLVRITPYQPPDGSLTPPWEEVRSELHRDRSNPTLDAFQYLFPSHYVKSMPELTAYATPSFPPGRPLLAGLLDLTRRIHTEFRYDPKATTIATPLDDVLAHRHGVCQDFAHLEIGCLRALGLAARYVSGYMLTNPPAGRERLIGADASHAWVSVYCPGFGWFDVDPTNNLMPSEKHIYLAWGRDYDDVSPVRGIILGGNKHSVRVAVEVQPLQEN